NLEILLNPRLELVSNAQGNFDAVFHAQELNGFGDSKWEALARTFSGLPFLEITPEYYNWRHSAINIISLFRADPDKRRAAVWISGPLGYRSGGDPRWRYRMSVDLHNENWDVRNGFTGTAPVLASLNQRREAVSAEISRVVGWRWKWTLGMEISH